jgi:hypothetical protein
MSIYTDAQQNVEGLPPEVRDTWGAILDAASACDYEKLETLALAGQSGFSYSYGVDGSPAKFWAAREKEAANKDKPTSEYMRYLVSVIQLPYCEEDGPDGKHYFVWPRAHCSARTHADWQQLKGLYTQDQIDQMELGDLYVGFRVGILENGDWVYFIAGD